MELFLAFLAYSFLGWVCETVYCSLGSRSFVNRGFLNGPLCPIYGFGALAVVWLLTPVRQSVLLVFVLGLLVTSALEYLTSYLMEQLFHAKWWDYSHYRFHIHGRVCLLNSLMFGGLSVVAVELVDPLVRGLIRAVPLWGQLLLGSGLALCLAADLVISVKAALELGGKLEEIHRLAEEARQRRQEYLELLEERIAQRLEQSREEMWEKFSRLTVQERLEQYRQRAKREGITGGESLEDAIQRLNARIRELSQARGYTKRRLLKAFPTMRSGRYQDALERLRESLDERRNNKKQ